MIDSFDPYFSNFLLEWEGTTLENDPSDRGGATKFGIDQRSHPDVNIRTLTKAQAKQIYLLDYWTPVRANELSFPLDVVMMDIAVNNGRTRAVKWLQEIVGAIQDGVFGPKTMALAQKASPTSTARKLLQRREAFYRAIAKGSQSKFLKGWLNRNNSLRDYAGL